jgi:hypothetical protein
VSYGIAIEKKSALTVINDQGAERNNGSNSREPEEVTACSIGRGSAG